MEDEDRHDRHDDSYHDFKDDDRPHDDPPASNDNETRTEKGAEEAFPTTGIPNTAHNYFFGPNRVADPM